MTPSRRQQVEVISYIGPERLRNCTRELDGFSASLGFVFDRPVDARNLGDEPSGRNPFLRVYVIEAHGRVAEGRHGVTSPPHLQGLLDTENVVVWDRDRRDRDHGVPTLLLVNSCYSGKILEYAPKDMTIITSDAKQDLSYSSILGCYEELPFMSLFSGRFSSDHLAKMMGDSRLSPQ